MQVSIRKFECRDIPDKVRWINDPRNNRYLHYDLPLEIGKTEAWFEKNKDRTDRYDAVIEADGVSCGVIGLLGIDRTNRKAEFYITLGESSYRGRGVAFQAGKLLLEYAFDELELNRVYLYTERENLPGQRLFEKLGFRREGLLKEDLLSRGKFVDRYFYGLCREDFIHGTAPAAMDVPVQYLGEMDGNRLYVLREDLYPFSFGGNKARKGVLFFKEIDAGGYDCVVSYGSSSSNHCRVVANMAAQRNIPCHIISPEEGHETTYNSRMMEFFGAQFTICPVTQVRETIERKLAELAGQGYRPYFIAGGGHGNLGTQAYVDCYQRIRDYEATNGVVFDYVFHASGTGTTQAGLVCGKLLSGGSQNIVGISIARRNPYGGDVVKQSIRDYLNHVQVRWSEEQIAQATVFEDAYVDGGYGRKNAAVDCVIRDVMTNYGIALDATYTGKAFAGMKDYLQRNGIENQNILFIHTGGTPLFFDFLGA